MQCWLLIVDSASIQRCTGDHSFNTSNETAPFQRRLSVSGPTAGSVELLAAMGGEILIGYAVLFHRWFNDERII